MAHPGNQLLSVNQLVINESFITPDLRLSDTSWDDLRFPASADRLDVAATRYSYDYDELGISIEANARHPEEVIGNIVQMPHAWKEGSAVYPHIHWKQSQSAVPNWLIEYRAYNNGEAIPVSFIRAIAESPVFSYTSGDILQISSFPTIDMTGLSISSFVDIKIYRDTANTSGLFAGADPVASAVLLKEIDVHFEIDSLGSDLEFTKEAP